MKGAQHLGDAPDAGMWNPPDPGHLFGQVYLQGRVAVLGLRRVLGPGERSGPHAASTI